MKAVGGAWTVGSSGIQVADAFGSPVQTDGGPAITTVTAASWICSDSGAEPPDCGSVSVVS